jgi:DNA mismatch repair protein MutL
MTVMSANDETGAGLMLHNDGGTLEADVVPCSHRRGTTVIVRDLFFNVPARKKFMKSRRAEHLAIIRMLEQLVIPFSTTHFTLTMDGKRVFDLPQVDRCIDRIAAVTGPNFASTLIECRGERESADALVYVSAPSHATARPRFQSLYVNLRRINNDSVLYSVREAFSQFLRP